MNRSSKKLVGDGKPHERRHPLEGGGVRITTFVPFHFKKRGIKKVIVAPEGVSQPVAVTETPRVRIVVVPIFQRMTRNGTTKTNAETEKNA